MTIFVIVLSRCPHKVWEGGGGGGGGGECVGGLIMEGLLQLHTFS